MYQQAGSRLIPPMVVTTGSQQRQPLGVGSDRVMGQLQGGHGLTGGEQLQAAVVPAGGGIGIAQQGVDLLCDNTLGFRGLSPNGPIQ